MIDFILAFALVASFCGGFWCGKTFHSASEMWATIKSFVKREL